MTTIDASAIQEGLATVLLRPRVLLLQAVDSTNSYAKKLVARELGQGIVVVAESQQAGRGRFGRHWHSPVGGLYMSMAIKPPLHYSSLALLGLLTGCAAANAINQMTGLNARLKWPNDVMIREHKAGGILSEAISVGNEMTSVILGIGINQNTHSEDLPPELRNHATTILAELGRETSREELAYRIINNVDARLAMLASESSTSSIVEEWKTINMTIGEKVRVDDGREVINGLAVGITPTGSLRVKVGARLVEISAGDVLQD